MLEKMLETKNGKIWEIWKQFIKIRLTIWDMYRMKLKNKHIEKGQKSIP